MYELPEFNIKKRERKPFKGWFLIGAFLFGVLGGASTSYVFYLKIKQEVADAGVPIIHSEKIIEKEYIPQTTQEQKIIDIVKENSPSVVSVVAYKDVPVYEQTFQQDFFFIIPKLEQKGTERQQVGAGTGFIVSSDGLILTNKHVVSDKEAEYVVIMTDNKEYNAKVLARDPVQDLAIMKIEGGNSFKPLKLGSVDDIQIGQTVIAIGNALGRFQNTVSVGVISGLGRTIVATGPDFATERLEDIIQTDTAINRGNSGGPLINLKGEVVGINTAVSTEGENIGFAISIDKAKRSIEQVKTLGRISYPYMGVRYIILNKEISKARDIEVDYGALIVGDDEPAVVDGSPAQKAGIKEGDIILEINGEKITENNSLAKIISKYNPFESLNLKILRDGQEIYLNIILGEWEE
ncbi:MAG TPA: trypsin-like peptidase domain-containing protein [Candidatus Paceibacterota bacterium]|jgi:serine protease Do|nr:trypsin-like peptidase domain-containing protein [Candidatus Paceibacterota bacterium]